MSKTHQQLWEDCLRIIADNIRPEQYDAWFKPVTSLGFENGRLTLSVPSPFFAEHLEDTYLTILGATLRRVYGEEVRLFYHYNQISNRPDTGIDEAGLSSSPALKRPAATDLFQTKVEATFNSQLNPKYTFENYCGSTSNKIAKAIGEAIANDPKCKTFNPLFVFGPTGVGKTHLIQAIGIKIRENNPLARILYVSARLFESQYTVASHNGKINEFINFYQSIDTLIIDDIQDLIDKPRTQGTFFHIFNHLHQNQKQIILSSDCCPTQLKGMTDRLLSRFKWGMTVELERPDLQLRRNVLRLKADQDGLRLPEEVMDFIAENVTDSVRELEGIVVSLLAHATVMNRDITVDLARHVMANVVKMHRRTINFEMITQGVASHFNIDPEAIFTKSRKREISDARQMVMYMAKKHAKMPLTAIGTRLSRNHATVIYACKNIEQRLPFEKQLQEDVAAIEKTFIAD
ncbi:MAG: chromosomal replication initiator protein DnaA [Muribaculaceae bacterium]|jgi:chromosomal replication initiator protein|nr:chromosomal replication initiator protein DnaA [Muribaculaceae bacterium]